MPGKRILIVDADVTSRNFIARTLHERRFEVIQAGSGKEGLISAWRDRPDLMIVDPTMTDLAGEELAAKLRQDARTSGLPLIALSGDSSVTRVKSCLDAGFNEYITKTGQALSSLSDTIHRLLGITDAASKQGGFLIVFLSTKGGIGTSSLCANIAAQITRVRPEAQAAVLDLVLPIGSIGPIVNYQGKMNLATVADMAPAASGPSFFRDQLPGIETWGFRLLAGAPDPESAIRLNSARLWDLAASARLAYDFVLVDLGRSLDRFTLPLLQHADLIGLVISADPGSIDLTRILLDYLKLKRGKGNGLYAILNRASNLEGLSKEQAEKALDRPIQAVIPYLSNNLSLASHQHRPFSTRFPKDTAAVMFGDLARELCNLAEKQRRE